MTEKCTYENGSLKLCEALTDIILNNADQEFGLKRVCDSKVLRAIVYRNTDTCLVVVDFCPFCGESLK